MKPMTVGAVVAMVVSGSLVPGLAAAQEATLIYVALDECVHLERDSLAEELAWELGAKLGMRADDGLQVKVECHETGVVLTLLRTPGDIGPLIRTAQLEGLSDEEDRRWFLVALVELVDAARVPVAARKSRRVHPMVSRASLAQVLAFNPQTLFATDFKLEPAIPSDAVGLLAADESRVGTSAVVVDEVDDNDESDVSNDSLFLLASLGTSGPGSGPVLAGGLSWDHVPSSWWGWRLGARVGKTSAESDLGRVAAHMCWGHAGGFLRYPTSWLVLQGGLGAHMGVVRFSGDPNGGTASADVSVFGDPHMETDPPNATTKALPWAAMTGLLDVDLVVAEPLLIRLGIELGVVTWPAVALAADERSVAIDGIWSSAHAAVGWQW